MMLRKIVALSFLVLSACATSFPVPQSSAPVSDLPPPVATPQSAKERFVRATELNGCEVNQGNSAAILAGATLSVEDLARIMSELKAEGRGEVAADGTSFRLTSGACA